jgi:flagella basal body P-ring formation protein FlgA
MSMTRQLKTQIAVLIMLFPLFTLASPRLLVQQVEGFLLEQIEESYPEAMEVNLTVRPPDTRLKLDECVEPKLSLHGADQIRSRVLVRAECTDTFVLHLAANIEVKQPVVVTTTAVSRQSVLRADQLETETVNILAMSRQYLQATEEATGKVLTRSVRAGTQLTVGMLKNPDLVSRGDSVVIIASRGELVVRMPGVAMATGGMGEQINVRNESSDRVVKGWIKGPGEVHVPF